MATLYSSEYASLRLFCRSNMLRQSQMINLKNRETKWISLPDLIFEHCAKQADVLLLDPYSLESNKSSTMATFTLTNLWD